VQSAKINTYCTSEKQITLQKLIKISFCFILSRLYLVSFFLVTYFLAKVLHLLLVGQPKVNKVTIFLPFLRFVKRP